MQAQRLMVTGAWFFPGYGLGEIEGDDSLVQMSLQKSGVFYVFHAL